MAVAVLAERKCGMSSGSGGGSSGGGGGKCEHLLLPLAELKGAFRCYSRSKETAGDITALAQCREPQFATCAALSEPSDD